MWPRNKYRRPWTNTSDNQALSSQKRRSDKIRAALFFSKGFSRRMHGCDLCTYRLNICTSSAILTCGGSRDGHGEKSNSQTLSVGFRKDKASAEGAASEN